MKSTMKRDFIREKLICQGKRKKRKKINNSNLHIYCFTFKNENFYKMSLLKTLYL